MRRLTPVLFAVLAAAVGIPALAHDSHEPFSGNLIKASGPAVYYLDTGKRYAFPNVKTYATWYADFSNVHVISDAELAAYPLTGNVTYRPGVRLLKLQTDPKVYAVDEDRTLRWITSEAVAAELYGPSWSQQVEDLSDAFFVNYRVGAEIATASGYQRERATTSSNSISVELGTVSREYCNGLYSFTVESDDSGLYPATITVPDNCGMVRLTFKVRSTNVYYGGMRFTSSAFSSVQAAPGQSVTVDFVVSKTSVTFSSYWPTTDVLKATGSIQVQ